MRLATRFHRAFRAARRRSGMTQGALARASGLSISYVSLLESGQRTPTLEAIEALAAGLGVDPVALLKDRP